MRRKVTAQDIADELGLSRNTVSKALNNRNSIADSTRKIVIQKATEMGYKRIKSVPSMDRDFGFKKTGNIVAITHEYYIDASYWSIVSRGAADALSQAGYNMIFDYIKAVEEDSLIIPQNISADNVDGIIILGSLKADYIKELLKLKLPVVYVDAAMELFGTEFMRDTVLMENEESIYQITKSLIAQGHSQLGFIGDIGFCKSYYERWLGFKRALEEANLNLYHQFCITSKTLHHYQQLEEIKEPIDGLVPMPTAFICANDRSAIFLTKILKDKGLRIPLDIAISGFDDIFESTVVEPHLTTVRILKEELGQRAAEELLWRIQNPKRPIEVIHIATEAIYRESTIKVS